jgi:putative PIN family toxin of toxin-antitoxin system
MKAVLDSSVIVSAFLNPSGTPATLLQRAAEGAFALCLSEDILEETARALNRPRIQEGYGYATDEVEHFLALLIQAAEIVHDLQSVPAVSRDRNDDVIIAAALKAQAAYLVTGDNDLLSLGNHEGLLIVTPRDFLHLL